MYNRLPSKNYPHAELTHEVIAAAIAVQSELKPGLDEKIYERALCIELTERGIHFVQQPEFPVHFRGHDIGNLRPDIIVENKLIVDPKVVESFNKAHEAQMLGYLTITGLNLALLLNFKTIPLGKKRIIKSF